MLPQPISAETDPCLIRDRWGIREELARKLVRMATLAPDLGLSIISGYRTCQHQESLIAEGNPNAARADLSTHTIYPAVGADLWTTPTPVGAVKARFGYAATIVGLRWGGGSPVDDRGIPKDWNHVDLGPRRNFEQ